MMLNHSVISCRSVPSFLLTISRSLKTSVVQGSQSPPCLSSMSATSDLPFVLTTRARRPSLLRVSKHSSDGMMVAINSCSLSSDLKGCLWSRLSVWRDAEHARGWLPLPWAALRLRAFQVWTVSNIDCWKGVELFVRKDLWYDSCQTGGSLCCPEPCSHLLSGFLPQVFRTRSVSG